MIFKKIFIKRRSGTIAKNRLKLLLINDRVNCNPDTIVSIRKDMINVISKYVDIDKEHSVIEIQQKKTPYIMAQLPIKEVKI